MTDIVTKLAGVTFGDCRRNIQECRNNGLRICTVDREPNHPMDPNAVSVRFSHQFLLGYVPKEIAPVIARKIDAGEQFEAEIQSFNQMYPTGPLGVTVRIYRVPAA